MPRNDLIQLRSDTAANWVSVNPTLAVGETGFETDTGKLKVGTGSSDWNSLIYVTDASDIAGIIPSARISGSYTGITGLGTLTSLTIDGPSSPSFTLGDWNQAAWYSGITGDKGYLLVSNTQGDTAIYLRSTGADGVKLGASNSNTLQVGNGTATVVGTMNATAFVGPLTGNVTGNVSGTSATVTGAAQTAITSVGTLTGLTIGGAGSNRFITINAPTGYYAIQYFAINGTNKWHYELNPAGTRWSLVESGVAERIGVTNAGATFSGTVTATTFSGALSGNASTATNLSTNRTNWSTNGTISATVGQLAWKNYGNSHTIFDASNSTTPNGGAVNNTNAQVPWTATYPTLMGFNGSNTFGVRVDSARIADIASSVGTLSALTVDGPSSPSLTLGDWSVNGTWSVVEGYNGYLLMGNTSNRACYLRTNNAAAVNIGANGSDTLVVNNGNIVVNGTTANDKLNVIGGSAWFSAMPASAGATVVNNFGFLRYVTSRRELKDNIVNVELSDGLNRILALRPVEFTMKPEYLADANEFTPFDVKRGFIAQETADVDHGYGQWGWVDENQMMATTPALNGELPLEEATPIYWNHDAVIADLVASIQNISARLQQLEESNV